MGMNSRNNDMGISYKKNTLNGVFFMRKKTPKFGSLFSHKKDTVQGVFFITDSHIIIPRIHSHFFLLPSR